MIYYCCANDKNIGDYYSMLGLEKLIGIKSSYIFMAGNVELFKSQILNLKNDDILILGGGGLLKDHFEKYWNIILKLQPNLNFKVASFGIGVCDIKGKSTVLSDKMLLDINNLNKALYLRPYIPKALNGLAIETFCPSNFYFSNLNIDKQNIHLLYAEHPKLIGEDKNNKIKYILSKYCSENNFKFVVVDHMDSLNYIDLYAKSNMVVTSRLHGLILAQSMDKKVISISNDYKIEGYANKIGCIDNVIDLNDFSEKIFLDKISNYKIPKYSSLQINKSLQEDILQFKKSIGI